MIEPSLVVEKLITETDTRPGVINPTKTINAMGINLIDNVMTVRLRRFCP